DGHAGGKVPRPCLFERLAGLLDKARPDVAFAGCAMHDGIYQPHDADRVGAFNKGGTRLIERCKRGGTQEVHLRMPPTQDVTREATVAPQPLGTVDADSAKIQEKIDALRRSKYANRVVQERPPHLRVVRTREPTDRSVVLVVPCAGVYRIGKLAARRNGGGMA